MVGTKDEEKYIEGKCLSFSFASFVGLGVALWILKDKSDYAFMNPFGGAIIMWGITLAMHIAAFTSFRGDLSKNNN